MNEPRSGTPLEPCASCGRHRAPGPEACPHCGFRGTSGSVEKVSRRIFVATAIALGGAGIATVAAYWSSIRRRFPRTGWDGPPMTAEYAAPPGPYVGYGSWGALEKNLVRVIELDGQLRAVARELDARVAPARASGSPPDRLHADEWRGFAARWRAEFGAVRPAVEAWIPPVRAADPALAADLSTIVALVEELLGLWERRILSEAGQPPIDPSRIEEVERALEAHLGTPANDRYPSIVQRVMRLPPP